MNSFILQRSSHFDELHSIVKRCLNNPSSRYQYLLTPGVVHCNPLWTCMSQKTRLYLSNFCLTLAAVEWRVWVQETRFLGRPCFPFLIINCLCITICVSLFKCLRGVLLIKRKIDVWLSMQISFNVSTASTFINNRKTTWCVIWGHYYGDVGWTVCLLNDRI